MNSTILAVDVGKFNNVLCWSEPERRRAAFRTVRTSPDELCCERTRNRSLSSQP